jgi:hypothetical protein
MLKMQLRQLNFIKRLSLQETKSIHESNMYAEMETGETILAFANNEMLKMSTNIEPLQVVDRTQNTMPPNSP